MSRRRWWGLGAGGFVVALLLGALTGYYAQNHEPSKPSFVSVGAPSAEAQIHETYSGTGTFRVPAQVPAGTYMVTAGAGDFGCYWERLRALDGRKASVLSTGNASRGAYGRLVVTQHDVAVLFAGDCVWVRI